MLISKFVLLSSNLIWNGLKTVLLITCHHHPSPPTLHFNLSLSFGPQHEAKHTQKKLSFFFPSLFNSSRIAHDQQVEAKEFPNAWRNNAESHAQSNFTVNSFGHETVNLSREPELVLHEYQQDYVIQENVTKPKEHFQSFHFHHASGGRFKTVKDKRTDKTSCNSACTRLKSHLSICEITLWKSSGIFHCTIHWDWKKKISLYSST